MARHSDSRATADPEGDLDISIAPIGMKLMLLGSKLEELLHAFLSDLPALLGILPAASHTLSLSGWDIKHVSSMQTPLTLCVRLLWKQPSITIR